MRFRHFLPLLPALALPFFARPACSQEIDSQELLKLIEQSRQKKALNPDKQRLDILRNIKIDRSPAGIFTASLNEAHLPPKTTVPLTGPQPPAPKADDMGAFSAQVEALRCDIILGRWEQVAKFFSTIPPQIAGEAYQIILSKLLEPTPVNPLPEIQAQGARPYSQMGILPPFDWQGLAASAPVAPEGDVLKTLARLLPENPRPPQEFFDRLKKGIHYFGGTDPGDRKRAAQILLEIGFVREAGEYLPDLAAARTASDYDALNLIARYKAQLARREPKIAGKDAIPEAWEISTSFLTDPKAPIQARSDALFRALSLIPELHDERGKEWIRKTFQNPKGEGLELLASLGTLTAQSRENSDDKVRLEQLRLQAAAVNALLSTPGVDPAKWSWIFDLYARQWTYEAGVTQSKDQSNSRRMSRDYDDYGNVFYRQAETNYQGGGARPIPVAKLLECAPDQAWMDTLEATTREQALVASARLLLKVKEEDNAIVLIKPIAAVHSDQAEDLVREIIRVWGENHNPNQDNSYRSRYMYYYGANNQTGAIPLTRSKQERNLIELGALVKNIRSLGLQETFDQELADAFIASYSKAEVWRVESIESVFGATDTLSTSTLSSLLDRMRSNLAGLWPNPQLQQVYQTKRKDKELQQQVLAGYAAAEDIAIKALQKKPADSWKLASQLAALKFEESNYLNSISPENTHSAVIRASLDAMAAAAADYSASLPLDDPKKESPDVFLTWFYASLGSPTLEALKSFHQPSPGEYPRIKATLDKLPPESRERAVAAMATTLNTRLTNVSPDLKLRYLEGAIAILGKRKEMADASDVLAYYKDLVSEIELNAYLDGPDRIDPAVPFGVFVNIRHTREIEREAGGFQRYLQNQTASQFAFNFGRPPEDYRDKFEKAARTVLEDHFEVISVTFHSEKVESRTDPAPGWRLTPYAYLLLKAKGPQVDKIPPLKLDLDFLDTSGHVILPITSPEIPLDASGKAEARPLRDLRIVQTLDERKFAEKGSLFLEIKAVAHGLIPKLNDILDLSIPGFKVGAIEDPGVRISELDPETDDLAPLSEADWIVELKPAGNTLPTSFHFPKAKVETVAKDGFTLQRYEDVDMVPVAQDIRLDSRSGPQSLWKPAGILLLFCALIGVLLTFGKRRKKVAAASNLEPLPSRFNAVTVIGFLRKLRRKESMDSETQVALDAEIQALEASYFGLAAPSEDPVKLREIATRWQARIPLTPETAAVELRG